MLRPGLILVGLLFGAGALQAQTVPLPLASNVANLPNCGSARNGMVYGVRDALSPVVGDVVVGGGVVRVVVQCDTSAAGIKWVVQAPGAGGGGASTFDELGSGTNTTAAMVVGTGASLSATGSGTIAATSATTATTATTANAGDSATAFFSAGTIEHERGGLEVDASAFAGLVRIAAGSTTAVTSLSGLNTALGSSIADGAHTTDTTCNDAGVACLFAASVSEGGPATTATALAANGGNCLAGSYPLGVDASGAVESCTDATTEIDSAITTHTSNANAHHTPTVDTGPSPDCTGTSTYQDGEGNCNDLDAVYLGIAADAAGVAANSVALGADTTGNYVASATANQGLTVTGTEGASVGLIDCAASEILKRNAGDTAWECAADGGGAGGGSMPAKEFYWSAASLLPAQPADLIPPLAVAQGTAFDLTYRGFDDATDECVSQTLKVPAEIDTAGTVTFRVVWSSGSATSGSVVWDFRHVARTEGEAWDAALTTESAASDAVQGTVGLVTITTWTETVANLGWAAGDEVYFLNCRDGNGTAGTDDLLGDARHHSLGVLVPQAE